MKEREIVRKAIHDFGWSNFGLDNLDRDVNPGFSDEWEYALAREIVAALDKAGKL